jgi:hypothetical protein
MPEYTKAALHKYQHPDPARLEHSQHTWNPPIYGATTQFVSDTEPSPALSDKDVNKLQQLTGTLLYYARAIGPTLIMTINVLASEQSNVTEITADKVIKLLNYCNIHPETKTRYHASDMILHNYSDASYLSENEAKSRSGGFFDMVNTSKKRQKTHKRSNFDCQQSPLTRNVVSSGSRNWSSFHRCKGRSCPQNNIEGIGTQAVATPMETDNTTATGYSNGTIKQKRTKAMDMRFYWIKDQVKQGQFKINSGQGFQNLADCFTKHHSPAHHKRIGDVYIHADERPINRKGTRDSDLRGCAKTSGKVVE